MWQTQKKKLILCDVTSDMPVTLVTPGKPRKFKIQVQSSKSRVAVWGLSPHRASRINKEIGSDLSLGPDWYVRTVSPATSQAEDTKLFHSTLSRGVAGNGGL